MLRILPLSIALLAAACGAPSEAPADAATPDLALPDLAPGSKAAACASTFGDALTSAFGRLDGTVLAIVKPSDRQCAQPNDDHLVLQVLAGGAAYRMVVNVRSDGADPDVRFADVPHALTGPAWAEGWHAGVGVVLDYPRHLGLHAGVGFAPTPMADLVATLDDAIPLGEPVSVFARSSGGAKADSAHLVHRNGGNDDGAIVLGPRSTSPRYLVFHFADQSF